MVRRLALVFCALIPMAALGCGGGAKGDTTTSLPGKDRGSETASNPSTEPTLAMPASRYAISVDDMPKDPSTGNAAYLTDLRATFVLDVKNYGKTTAFSSADEGERLLTQWGYLGGYETGLIPEGRDATVLNGGYYVNVEVHLFKTADGAKKAFDQFNGVLSAGGKSQQVQTTALGNQSSAWTLTEGKVGNSTVNMVYHQLIFRRGNLVAAVLTRGAEGFMKVDTVRSVAAIVDQKALGQKQAIEPTPIPTAVPPSSPSPTRKP